MRIALASACVLLLAAPPSSRAADPPDFVLHELGSGVWAAISSDTGRAFGNAGFVVGDDGVAVIDAFQDPRAAEELLAQIHEITRLPIRFVVDTHYHFDHVNGNDVFAAAGAIVVAHRYVRAWMRSDNLKFWTGTIPRDITHRVQSLKLPDVDYDDHIALHLGSRALEVRHFPGHTGSDSVVVVPDARVVFCGDLLWKDHFPNLIDASTEEWIGTLGSLQTAYDSRAYVPGHGGIATGHDVAVFREFLASLRALVEHARAEGKSGTGTVDAILSRLRSSYPSWAFLDRYARDDIAQTVEELSGRKRLPPTADGR